MVHLKYRKWLYVPGHITSTVGEAKSPLNLHDEYTMSARLLLAATIAGLASFGGALAMTSADGISEAQAAAVPAQAPAPFTHVLAPLDGSHLKVTLVEVRYGPGKSSPPHSHPCPVIGRVIEGSLRTQVRGEPEAVYTAGQSFYEAANGAHVISANASTDKPVRFLAYFTCDRETPLMQPVPDAAPNVHP
jgi:quercetin dioxygenase-like cupin family protein